MTSPPTLSRPAFDLAVIGAGPVGLGLALHAARRLPEVRVTLYDARSLEADVSGDPRTLALALGSVQWLERLGAWNAAAAQPIFEVHVSQASPGALRWPGSALREPALRIRAADEGVPMLGAVLPYGRIVAPLQAAWQAAVAREPARLASRFGTPVAALKNTGGGVEVDAGIVWQHDLAVVAEGGVYGGAAHRALAPHGRPALSRDYRQVAWVGEATLEGAVTPGCAFERFTRHGPAALQPLRPDGSRQRAGLVWCVAADDDPVAELDAAQRATVLNTVFPRAAGRIVGLSALKRFPLGLSAERTLVDGRTVRIGNAAQTLHPVAGQGLNLGLRDAHALVQALARTPDGDLDATRRSVEWRRAPDRWALIAATDFLARSFTWQVPGLGAARGLGLAALQAFGPAKSLLARRMMFGLR